MLVWDLQRCSNISLLATLGFKPTHPNIGVFFLLTLFFYKGKLKQFEKRKSEIEQFILAVIGKHNI